jgi:hypothetical protein
MRPCPRKLLVLSLLAGACSAPPTSETSAPLRSVGLADIVGRVSLASGPLEREALSVEWTNVDRRETGREPEHGMVLDFAEDGSFRIPALPFGTYALTVHYSASKERLLRVQVDEDQERVDIALPAGRIVVRAASGEVLDHVTVRSFGSSKALLDVGKRGTLPPEGVVASGLGPGRYAVDAVFEGQTRASATVTLSAEQEEQTLELGPADEQHVALRWSGALPSHDEYGRVVIEAYGRAPDDRLFDFGGLRSSRRVALRKPDVSNGTRIGLPAGDLGLLVLLRDGQQASTALLAWLPEVKVGDDQPQAVTVEMPRLRIVQVITPDGKPAPAKSWAVSLGEDVLPASLLFDSSAGSTSDGPIRLPVGASVVSGGARRRGGEEGGQVVNVEAGVGVQKIVLAD